MTARWEFYALGNPATMPGYYEKEETIMVSLKKVASSLAATVAVGSGTLIVAAPAADAAVFNCPTSTVCVYEHTGLWGNQQNISGYAAYTDLNGHLHDKASSWINANVRTSMAIGEWRSGRQHIGQVLPPGWYEDNLHNVNFGDKADFVKQT